MFVTHIINILVFFVLGINIWAEHLAVHSLVFIFLIKFKQPKKTNICSIFLYLLQVVMIGIEYNDNNPVSYFIDKIHIKIIPYK